MVGVPALPCRVESLSVMWIIRADRHFVSIEKKPARVANEVVNTGIIELIKSVQVSVKLYSCDVICCASADGLEHVLMSVERSRSSLTCRLNHLSRDLGLYYIKRKLNGKRTILVHEQLYGYRGMQCSRRYTIGLDDCAFNARTANINTFRVTNNYMFG